MSLSHEIVVADEAEPREQLKMLILITAFANSRPTNARRSELYI